MSVDHFMLHNRIIHLSGLHNANNGSLDDIFSVFIDGFQNIGSLRLDFCFDGQVEIDTDLQGVRNNNKPEPGGIPSST
jgi:hypothetical protein